jgi:hypothetical protein
VRFDALLLFLPGDDRRVILSYLGVAALRAVQPEIEPL